MGYTYRDLGGKKASSTPQFHSNRPNWTTGVALPRAGRGLPLCPRRLASKQASKQDSLEDGVALKRESGGLSLAFAPKQRQTAFRTGQQKGQAWGFHRLEVVGMPGLGSFVVDPLNQCARTHWGEASDPFRLCGRRQRDREPETETGRERERDCIAPPSVIRYRRL